MRSGPRGIERAALLLTIAAGACAGHLPPCPAAGGPAWLEAQSAHFRLRTDGTAADARATLEDLEQFQAALLTVFGAPGDHDTGRMPVIVVDRGWTDFAPHRVDGYFTHALFQPLIVMRAGSDLFRQDVVKHELVHHFSQMVMARQPPWLSEGLATYYQTLEYEPAEARITVGRPPPERLRDAQRIGTSELTGMFAAEDVGDDPDVFYAAAWLTVHYLMNHRVEALGRYEKALHHGATPAAAWTAAFGAETPATLGAEIVRYVDGGQYALLRYRFEAPRRAPPAERRLSDAETHATRATLYLTGPSPHGQTPDLAPGVGNPRGEAKIEVGEALRQEPDQVAAHAIAHFMLGARIDLDQATALSRKHADDWLAWLLVADAMPARDGGADPNDALERALDIASRDRSIHIPIEAR